MRLPLAILFGCLIGGVAAGNRLECGKVDIVFVADRSGSVGSSDFDLLLEFIENVVDTFQTIGPDDIQVGLVAFASSASAEIELHTHDDKQDLQNDIANTAYTGGLTDTSAAIDMAAGMLSGGRSDAEKVIILLTDGEPCCEANSLNDALNSAQAAKNAGIKLFAVGIGSNINFSTLEQLACSRNRVFQPCGFNNLGKIVNRLASKACGAFSRVDCDPWVYYNAHAYKFCRTKVNYWTAREICEDYGAYVVEVNDVGENIFISDLIGCSRWRYAFLGAYSKYVKNHEFHWWSEGNTNLFYPCHPDDYPNCRFEAFSPGQPDNENWDRCIQLDLNEPNFGRWEDINCWRWRTFVCERDCCAPQEIAA